MAAYSVSFRDSVWRDLDFIPKKELKRIMARIGLLAKNPRPLGCVKLAGRECYRVRQYDYRIIYSIQDEQLIVWIVKEENRKDVYR